MLSLIFTLLLIAVILFAVIVATQAEDFRVTRSITMSASAEKIFPHVNDLHQWKPWSPWAKLDPNATTSFEGSSNGVGAIMRWAGNNQVGEGSMTILQSRSPEFIQFKLDFLKPMKATHTSEFSFQQKETQTVVTWEMYGKNNFVGKAMSLIFNCDKMVGAQFEKGLADLKQIVESE